MIGGCAQTGAANADAIRLNLVFLALSVLLHLGLAWLVVFASAWSRSHGLGLLPWLNLPAVAEGMVGLLLLELTAAWFPHWLMHRVDWLWRWHLVHHSDPQVDTTTGVRTHPCDVLLRLLAEVVAVALLGAPLWMIIGYESLVTVATLFGHANVALPRWLDRGMNWLVVTPNFHRVHHHPDQPLTDRNYGLVFTVWDRLFRTRLEVDDPRRLRMGIDSHPEAAQNSRLVPLLLAFPARPATTRPARDGAESPGLSAERWG